MDSRAIVSAAIGSPRPSSGRVFSNRAAVQQTPPPTNVKSGAIKNDSAIITFESEVIDYGSIAHMSGGNREFKFKNTAN